MTFADEIEQETEAIGRKNFLHLKRKGVFTCGILRDSAVHSDVWFYNPGAIGRPYFSS